MGEKKQEQRIYPLKYRANLDHNDSNTKVYFEHLDMIMDMDELHNIAVTGNRGAGKSSILHSYDSFKSPSGEKFLYISLAEFENYIEEVAAEEAAQIDKENKKPAAAAGSAADTGSGTEQPVQVPATGTGSDAEQPAAAAADSAADTETINPITLKKQRKKLGLAGRERIQKRLEYSLVCQILARCTKEDLRSSSLRAITEVRGARRWVKLRYAYVIILALLVGVLMYDAKFKLFQTFFFEGEEKIYHSIHMSLYAITAVMTVGLGAYLFSRKPGFFRFGKLNVKTGKVEAEIVPSENVYCLDKYRFDLVYILNQIADKIGYTVIIEDLELVGDCCAEEIVSKLRELNLMVNTHRREQYRSGESFIARWKRKIKSFRDNLLTDRENAGDSNSWNLSETKQDGVKKCAKPIRFIYAISDETFDEEERTKFFDTILPMTPALNATNAYETLKNCFVGKSGISNPEADVFIQKLSKAVTDYRMLNDIMTEYRFFSRWHEENSKKAEDGQEKKQDKPTSVPKDWTKRHGIFGRIFHRKSKGVDPAKETRQPEENMSEEQKQREEEKRKQAEEENKEEQRTERKLIAIAIYKALLPYEYHCAYTPDMWGILIDPAKDPIPGRSYRESTVECVKYLFNEGYLDAKVLTLIGFSEEVLKRQWADILTNGNTIQQLDLLYRFRPAEAAGQEKPHQSLFSEAVRKSASEGVLDQNKEIELVVELGQQIFKDSNDALAGLFGKLYDDKLTPDGLVNLLICLNSFDENDVKAALQNVNQGDEHDAQLNVFQNKLQKCLNKASFVARFKDREFYEKVEGCSSLIEILTNTETDVSWWDNFWNALTA